jgi:hypothetical protein
MIQLSPTDPVFRSGYQFVLYQTFPDSESEESHLLDTRRKKRILRMSQTKPNAKLGRSNIATFTTREELLFIGSKKVQTYMHILQLGLAVSHTGAVPAGGWSVMWLHVGIVFNICGAVTRVVNSVHQICDMITQPE